jgi:hypothetical protein
MDRASDHQDIRGAMLEMFDQAAQPITINEIIRRAARTNDQHVVDLHESTPRQAHQVLRRLVVSCVVIVVGLSTALFAAQSDNRSSLALTTPPPPAGNLSRLVLVTRLVEVGVKDAPPVYEQTAIGDRRLAVPKVASARDKVSLVISGSEVVAVSLGDTAGDPPNGTVLAFPLGSTSTRTLGLANAAYSGTVPDTVWLVTVGSDVGGRLRDCKARLVTVTGLERVMPTRYPCDTQRILGATQRGLLLQDITSGSLTVWNPDLNTTTSIPGGQSSQGVAEGGDTIVTTTWSSCSGSCQLRLADATNGETRLLDLEVPSGMAIDTQGIAVSPDGLFTAVLASTPVGGGVEKSSPCCYQGAREVEGRLFIFRTTDGRLAMTRSLAVLAPTGLAWTPGDAFVVVTRTLSAAAAVPTWSATAAETVVDFPTGGRPGQGRWLYPGEMPLLAERPIQIAP